jgi:hypothetical protein
MLRRILCSIGRALVGVITFPFVFAGSAFRALVGMPMPPPADFEDDEQVIADTQSDALKDLIEVKRWAAAMLANRPVNPCGRYSHWMQALNRECAGKIATAAAADRLRHHLEGSLLFPGIPPVGTFEHTRQWLADRAVTLRRTEYLPAAERAPSPEQQAFGLTP